MSCSPSKPPTTLKEMWIENLAWSMANFPDRTLLDVLKHIQKEVYELGAARLAYKHRAMDHNLFKSDASRESLENARQAMLSECADVIILTAQIMLMVDADPETEILRKWAEVQERTYIDGERVV